MQKPTTIEEMESERVDTFNYLEVLFFKNTKCILIFFNYTQIQKHQIVNTYSNTW